jgi:two-component system, OmpR family, response regulator
MRHQGRVLTRAQLLENVWGWDYAGESQIIETYVSYLRRKLDPLGPPLIHTQRGVGYSLRLPEHAALPRPSHAVETLQPEPATGQPDAESEGA